MALALQILDGMPTRAGGRLHVERAHFEMKGEGFDPSKRGGRRKLTSKEKLKLKERQKKCEFLNPNVNCSPFNAYFGPG